MQVTSIHHMYPGTEVYTVINPGFGNPYIETKFMIVSWPYEVYLPRDDSPGDWFLGWCVDTKTADWDSRAFLADYGMGDKTHGNISFTTWREAEECRKRLAKQKEQCISYQSLSGNLSASYSAQCFWV